MRIILACLLVVGCARASTGLAPLMGWDTRPGDGPVLSAQTKPLDLDGNGLCEWLSVRFHLPVAEPGPFSMHGEVFAPTDTGRSYDNVYPPGWDLRRSSVPGINVNCDSCSVRPRYGSLAEIWHERVSIAS